MGPPTGWSGKVGVSRVAFEPFVAEIADLAGDGGDVQTAEAHAHEHRTDGYPTGCDAVRP